MHNSASRFGNFGMVLGNDRSSRVAPGLPLRYSRCSTHALVRDSVEFLQREKPV